MNSMGAKIEVNGTEAKYVVVFVVVAAVAVYYVKFSFLCF